MKLINKTTWKRAILRKKSGTRPGPGHLTVDMLKAANEKFTELTRLMANTALAHRQPLSDWKHSWCYKLPKTKGLPKATKLRPLRFLNVMRKMLMEDAIANRKNLYLLDVDLSGGYDRIQRWVLHSSLLRFGVDEDTIDFILNMASMCTVGVLSAFGECDAFKPEAGALAQGCDTSCALWVCMTDWWLDTMQSYNTNPYLYQTSATSTPTTS